MLVKLYSKFFFVSTYQERCSLGSRSLRRIQSSPIQSHPKIARDSPNFICDGIVGVVLIVVVLIVVVFIVVVFIVVAFRYVVFSRLF